ncbi:hypothetical protein RUM44_008077 [Polyplax serrata]|uniref:TIR domain-containing protein n=1 Tax=Polyplax serrata TaxID=468196 RepID=A0ABR1B7N8_POLSC
MKNGTHAGSWYAKSALPSGRNVYNSTERNESSHVDFPTKSCQYYQFNEQLVCNGSIDLPYLKSIQERIRELIVENYTGEPPVRKALSPVRSWDGETGEQFYMRFPKTYQKITGRVHLKDTGLQLNVIIRIIPKGNLISHEYTVEGEAFSTKLVRISRRLKGYLNLHLVKKRIVVTINVETIQSDVKWSLQSNLTLYGTNSRSHYDEWVVDGNIQSDTIDENEVGLFGGTVKTKMTKGEFKFFGEVTLQNANLVWNLKGRITSSTTEQVTIPRAAFSNMFVQRIIFKNSDFYNDFDKDGFEGMKGVESISFLSSKLEGMPKMNKLFESFTDLREIYIEDCTTPQLRFGAKATLTNVQKVSFAGTGPLNFHELSFLWLRASNVSYLNLRNSYVILLNEENFVLRGISNSLLYLDISNSNLGQEKQLASILHDLKLVYLAAEDLQLKKIPTAAMGQVNGTLKYLSLKGNNFGKVLEENMFDTIFNFPKMLQLEELNLADCQINYIEREAFDPLPNLKILHLENNNLENLQDGWILTRPKLTHLDLSSNGLTPQMSYLEHKEMETTLDLSIFTELRVLNLSDGVFLNTTKIVLSLNGNLRQLSLRNTNLDTVPENIFYKLTLLEFLDISYNKNFKTIRTFSIEIFRNLVKLKTLILQGCQINVASLYQKTSNYSFMALTHLEYLDLSYNNIKMNDFVMFKIFPNLKFLKLTGNGIASWKNSLLNFSVQLEGIYLDENKIETLSSRMLQDIERFKFVKLGNNPFVCGPYVYDILKMVNGTTEKYQNVSKFAYKIDSDKLGTGELRKPELINFDFVDCTELSTHDSGNRKVHILDWSETNYVCFSRSKIKFLPFTRVNENFETVERARSGLYGNVFLWLLVPAIFGVVFTIGIVCWKILDIHLITKAVRNAVALSFLSRKSKEPENYEYNLFVSYSDKDRPWVIDCLIPQIQSKGDVKVCLHERDFQVGLSILENIISSIENSRNIMLVLSTSFLKSQWCQYEMHLAQHRLLEKGRDQLILILLEDIPIFKRPRILRYLMMTKTYLEWPAKCKNPKEIELFWSRLLKSLSYAAMEHECAIVIPANRRNGGNRYGYLKMEGE